MSHGRAASSGAVQTADPHGEPAGWGRAVGHFGEPHLLPRNPRGPVLALSRLESLKARRHRLRVLTLIHGFYPLRGGAETAALEIASRLAREDVDMAVLTAGFTGLPPEEKIEGVRVLRAWSPPGRALGPSGPGGMVAFAIAAVLSGLRIAEAVDVVHAHFTIPAGLVALYLQRRRKVPFVVTLHGSDVPGYNEARPFAALYESTRPLARAVWRAAGCVEAVTGSLAERAREIEPGGRIEVIPNGVDTRRFAPAPEGAREAGRILLVGRLIPLKGHAVFLRALGRVSERWRGPLSAEILGTGPELESLCNAARELGLQDIVEIAGFVPFEDLPSRYATASLFVMPSLSEALPLAVLEAMAAGLPVIASSVGGIPEALSGIDAVLVPPGDEVALADAIVELLSRPDRARDMARESRTKALTFDWDRIASRYLHVYEDLARSRRRT